MMDAFVKWSEVRVSQANGEWAVYALIDPRDDTVRYVGVTASTAVEYRLARHRAKPPSRRVREWFAALSAVDAAPVARVICQADDRDESEREWIEWFRARGQLYNVLGGGNGGAMPGAGRPVTTGTLRPPPVSFRLTVEDQALLDEVAAADGVSVHAAAKALTLAALAARLAR